MKKLAVILTLLLSFGFSQIMIPDTSIMTSTEKMLWYQNEKKSPALAVFFNTILPTAGYAYAGDWKRGIKFKATEIGLLVGGPLIMYFKAEEFPSAEHISRGGYCTNCMDYDLHPIFGAIGVIMIVGVPIVFIWEFIDVAKTTKKYNNQLYKNLFGKDGSMQFSLIPQPKGIGLGLSYNF